ncbi:Uncharacterised protein [Mycobacterium tuberculosis]|nr:Uncharacterised protein [Mycobacterium tuberculosis]
MRHQHHRTSVAAQRVEHLLARGRIEIVGRFIEQQHIRGGGHQAGQREPGLLTAGERAGRLLELRTGEHERTQQAAQVLFAGIRCRVPDVLPNGGIVVERVVLLREIADP